MQFTGKLASSAEDDAIAKAKREELRQKLLNGGRIVISPNNDESHIAIPTGKLAAKQWYEVDPSF